MDTIVREELPTSPEVGAGRRRDQQAAVKRIDGRRAGVIRPLIVFR
jgi:hypothetical protein